MCRYYMLGASEAGGAGCSTTSGTSPTATARTDDAITAGKERLMHMHFP
jgi:hypothetical protein